LLWKRPRSFFIFKEGGMKKIKGVVNLLKPPGMTSHDAVDYLRKLLNEKKIGHTGTLDPAACGVLPLCLGKATRLAEYTMQHRKSYRAEMILGITTDTQDITGTILSKKNVSNVSKELLEDALKKFTGKIKQIPPAFSAVHHKGKRFYELARKGNAVPKKTRTVKIEKIKIFKYYPEASHPRIMLDITCSRGTYIRTLCADIGEYLGTGAVLSFLIRTASGPFKLENTITIEEIKEKISCKNFDFILPMSMLVQHLPTVEIKPSVLKAIKNGMPIGLQYLCEADKINNRSLVKITCKDELIAIGLFNINEKEIIIKPKKVLA